MNGAVPEQRRQVARCGGTILSGEPKRHTADRAEGPRPVGFWKESATDQKQRYDAEKISSLNPRRSSERAGVEFFQPVHPGFRSGAFTVDHPLSGSRSFFECPVASERSGTSRSGMTGSENFEKQLWRVRGQHVEKEVKGPVESAGEKVDGADGFVHIAVDCRRQAEG
ncbi:MAG: hypothetical protein M8863_11360, partial [marine benthic group bacterium]|nr:hypothetical protein [Gemmatimonadota bacterium]